MKLRLWLGITAVLVFLFAIAGYMVCTKKMSGTLSPLSTVLSQEKPLEKYTIENLSNISFPPSQIVFDVPIATKSSYMVVPFHFFVDALTSSHEAGVREARKKVTGLAHVPMTPKSTKMPVIIQCRGFVPKESYSPGVGTQRSAEVYAANGFLSLAPDFFGYGGSDTESQDVFESRFETYTTILTLLASVGTIPYADTEHVFLWGHSNGGQIALTVLSILGDAGVAHPTTLWAPVTKRFPYSILYYTDEADDYGKFLRKELAAFEAEYDVEAFTFMNYVEKIRAPILLHQGSEDPSVPKKWNDEFVQIMQKNTKRLTYHTYSGADHNLSSAWNTVVARDIQFFRSFLKEQ